MICRVCLEDSYSFLNIYEESGKLYDIANILEKYLWFKPCPEDPISTSVCCDCWQSVHDFHQFYIKAKQAHLNLTNKQSEVCTSEVEVDSKISPDEQASEQLEPAISIKEEYVENIYSENLSYPNEIDAADDNVKDDLNPLEDLDAKVCGGDSDPVLAKDLVVDGDFSKKEKPKLRKRKLKRKSTPPSSPSPPPSPSPSQSPSPTVRKKPANRPKSYNKKRKVNAGVEENEKESKPSKRRISIENMTEVELELIKKHIPMQCDLCFFIADGYVAFADHFKNEHKGVKAYVKCCSRTLNRPFSFLQHALKHENPENNKCKVCNKSFSDPDVLRTHTLKFHAPKEQLKFGCDQCPKRFLNMYYLKLHLPMHIPQDKWNFVCKQCPQPKFFPSDHLLSTHKNMCHEKPVSVCHVCGKEFRYGPSFDKHVRSHFEVAGPRLKCTIPGCDTWLKDEENLKIHLKRHSENGQTHTCVICKKDFKNRNALWGHMRYNHSNITYDCTYCNKTFRKPRNLKEHMAAQHTGKFLYKCNFCERSFRANSNLCTHRKKIHPIEYDLWKKTKFCGLKNEIESLVNGV